MYIWELSFVYFSVIRNTVNCFQGCFPPATMSACVKWAKEEVETFNAILERQLISTEKGGEAWTMCMDQARSHAKMLSDVGLDFRNLVGKDSSVASGIDGSVGLGMSRAGRGMGQ